MKLDKIIYLAIGLITGLATFAFLKMGKKSEKTGAMNEYSDIQKILQSFPQKKQRALTSTSIDMQKMFDDYVQKYSSPGNFTGIHFAMQCPPYHNGETTTFTSGLQSNQGMPVSNDSLFQIGSISKSFASVVILQLEAEEWEVPGGKGKFTIENQVGDFFPGEYPIWENITIKQLLNMTSGIPDYFNDGPIVGDMVANPYYYFTTDELLNSVKNSKLMFQPGENYHYSNTDYALAGKIIEKVTKKNVAEEIENRIIKPLHMEHTFYIKTFPKNDVPQNAEPYLMSGYDNFTNIEPYFKFGQDIINYSLSWANAAASLISNISDLSIYGRRLFSKEPNERLLPQKQFDELISLVDNETGVSLPNGVNDEHPFGYGLGLLAVSGHVMNWGDLTLYGHIGQTQGFTATWYYIPEKDIFFSYSINAFSSSSDLMDPMLNFIYQNCF